MASARSGGTVTSSTYFFHSTKVSRLQNNYPYFSPADRRLKLRNFYVSNSNCNITYRSVLLPLCCSFTRGFRDDILRVCNSCKFYTTRSNHIQSHTVRINVRSVSRRIISHFTSHTFVTELPMGVGPKIGKWRRHQRKLHNIKPQTARSRSPARTV